MSTITDVGKEECVSLEERGALFFRWYAICADPVNPDGWWIGGETVIRYRDGQRLSLVAGGEEDGHADGVGEEARFSFVFGMVCTSDRKRMYFSDQECNRIRAIELESRQVTTIAGSGKEMHAD